MSKQQDLDLLIVGGGLVGCSLALALRSSDCRVALLEAQAGGAQSPPSLRVGLQKVWIAG